MNADKRLPVKWMQTETDLSAFIPESLFYVVRDPEVMMITFPADQYSGNWIKVGRWGGGCITTWLEPLV